MEEGREGGREGIKLLMMELTVPFETGFQAAAERKTASYEDLVHRARQSGYNTHLITVEVGAQGIPHMAGFSKLKQELGLTRTELSSLLSRISHKARLSFASPPTHPPHTYTHSFWRGLYCRYHPHERASELRDEVLGSLTQQNNCIMEHVRFLQQVLGTVCVPSLYFRRGKSCCLAVQAGFHTGFFPGGEGWGGGGGGGGGGMYMHAKGSCVSVHPLGFYIF